MKSNERRCLYLVELNPSRGSEQAGIRPAILVQTDNLDRFTSAP